VSSNNFRYMLLQIKYFRECNLPAEYVKKKGNRAAKPAGFCYILVRSRWNIMNTVMKSALYLFMATAVLLFVAACSGTAGIGEAPTDAVCSSIVDAKCVKCHYKTRICDALGTKSVSSWKRTIKFMLKQGAQLSADEQNKVIACLSSLPKGSGVVCD
jgi:hypothetical protein